MHRVTPWRFAKALLRDGLAHVLREMLRRVEVPEPPAPPRPAWRITVYGESGEAPIRVLSLDRGER